ncbi:unnamed protein product, partial [Brachionus calyciflorus]
MNDFIGLAAMITNNNFDKECLVIGFEKMVGPHYDEIIKKIIELIVNSYDFDRSKIKVLYATKEAPLRLFKQFDTNEYIGYDFDNEDESDNDEESDNLDDKIKAIEKVLNLKEVVNELRVLIKDMNSIKVENVPENEYLIENDRGLFEDLVIELDDEKENNQQIANKNKKHIEKKKILDDDDDDDLFFILHKDDEDVEEEKQETNQNKTNISKLRKEKDIFISLINKPVEENEETLSRKQFWNKNKKNASFVFSFKNFDNHS